MSIETIEQAFKGFLAEDADISLSLGMDNKLGELGDPSLQAHENSIIQAKALLAQIDKHPGGEGFYDKLDLHLISLYLQRDLFFKELRFNGKLQRQQKPGGIDGISEGIYQLFVNDPRSAEERLNNILSRLQGIPKYLQVESEVLDTPVHRWVDIEVQQGEGLPSLFAVIVNWAKQENYSSLAELESVISIANSAIEKYIWNIQSLPTVKEFAIGEAKVKQLLALREIDASPEQLREMAQDYLLSTANTIEDLRIKLIEKYKLDENTDADKLSGFLDKQYRVTLQEDKARSILDEYTKENSRIIDFLNKHDLFPLPEQQSLRLLQTPDFLEPVIPAGAMWPPVVFHPGDKTSLIYLTLSDARVNEHTYLSIPTMMIHEGIPGHHLQFASAALQPSFVRKIFDAPEHAEGWTTMLEDYMLDQGYIAANIKDEIQFITKREISRLAARVAIDLYFMIGDKEYLEIGLDLTFTSDDPFKNAALLLQTATGFSDKRTQAELNWYSTERSYPLCYLTGNQMVWKLKVEIEQHNANKLSSEDLDKRFHKIYLHSGCMPVKSLREVCRHEGLLA